MPEDVEDRKKVESMLPLTLSTVHTWMLKAGMKYKKAQATYYTDSHEAADGIEFAFGKMKFEQRKNNEGKKSLGGQVFTEGIKILCTEGALQHLPMARVWKFNRRARDYERVYVSASGRDGDHSLTHAEIEFMRKNMTSHRNIMEQERKFIRAV
jgi:hypothetical protein